jgi:acyl dehydratase
MGADQLVAGATFERVLVDDLTRTQIVQYAGASGDYNPLHTDERYAVEVAGYPGVFSHGMLIAGMTAEGLSEIVWDGFVRRFGGRFKTLVWAGDTLTLTATVVSVAEEAGCTVVNFDLSTVNQDGVAVFQGSAEVLVGADAGCSTRLAGE